MVSPLRWPRVAYWEHLSQVIWIDLPQRRLQGFDNYWVAWPRYGMWQDAENIGVMYSDEPGAIHAIAFEDRGDHEVQIDPFPLPPGAMWWRGYMLTDDQAKFVGLI